MSYTAAKTLPNHSRVELMDKRDFVKAVWDKNLETFVMHIVDLVITGVDSIEVHSFQVPQLAALQWDKALAKIQAKYINYVDIFLHNLPMEFPKNTSINKYIIMLVEGKQLLYGPIYAPSLVKLETLKMYIKIHLKTVLIQSFKSSTYALIFFNKNLDGSLCLCVTYGGLNNLTTKNWYPLPLINP